MFLKALLLNSNHSICLLAVTLGYTFLYVNIFYYLGNFYYLVFFIETLMPFPYTSLGEINNQKN